MATEATTTDAGSEDGFEGAGDSDLCGACAVSWTDRLVAAASDYEAIDSESLAGLGREG